MKAERIESALQPRSWSFNRQAGAEARHFLLLTDGAGEAEAGSARMQLTAPAVLWLGDMKPGRLRIAAGATGYRGWADAAASEAALGDRPDSVPVRQLIERDFVLSLAGQEAAGEIVARCFNAALGEQQNPRAGSEMLLSALLRIVLVTVFRVAGGDVAPLPGGGREGLLQRFRQLVELNFRNHLRIARYAEELGVTTDRLHAVCTSAVGKSPKRLVSERLAHEAALRLERSALGVQQLGHSLGFNDPAHFSNFFRRMTGMTPAAYRRAARGAQAGRNHSAARGFAEWP